MSGYGGFGVWGCLGIWRYGYGDGGWMDCEEVIKKKKSRLWSLRLLGAWRFKDRFRIE